MIYVRFVDVLSVSKNTLHLHFYRHFDQMSLVFAARWRDHHHIENTIFYIYFIQAYFVRSQSKLILNSPLL